MPMQTTYGRNTRSANLLNSSSSNSVLESNKMDPIPAGRRDESNIEACIRAIVKQELELFRQEFLSTTGGIVGNKNGFEPQSPVQKKVVQASFGVNNNDSRSPSKPVVGGFSSPDRPPIASSSRTRNYRDSPVQAYELKTTKNSANKVNNNNVNNNKVNNVSNAAPAALTVNMESYGRNVFAKTEAKRSEQKWIKYAEKKSGYTDLRFNSFILQDLASELAVESVNVDKAHY